MAPDKIYVPTEYTDNDITPVGVTLRQVFPNDVCYIRKDALLEWAKNWKKLGQNDDFMYAIETLVRHLNSM